MTALASTVISDVKRLITMPPDDTLFNTSDYIRFINECLLEKIIPNLMQIRDDYCLIRQVFPLQNAQSQDLYPTGVMPIPNRAWGNTLREIKYIDSSGNYYKVNPYFLSDLDLYQTKNLAFSSAYQRGFISYNSGIKLIPPPLQDPGSIEMHYIVQPSEVVESETAYAQITNLVFNQNNNTITFTIDDVPPLAYLKVNGYSVGGTALFDIFNYKTGMFLYIDLPMTWTTDTTFTCPVIQQGGTNVLYPSPEELTNFQLGGYPVQSQIYLPQLFLVPSGISSFTPIPNVLDRVLNYEVALKLLSAMGDKEELDIFVQQHAELKKKMYAQMSMRVDAEPYVVKNTRGVRKAVMYGGGSRRYNR